MLNNAPLCGGRINIVFGEADPPRSYRVHAKGVVAVLVLKHRTSYTRRSPRRTPLQRQYWSGM